MNHRRPHSASAPPPPSALTAASTAYHPPGPSPPLAAAAAAAGAALRHASASPVPMDQRIGSIPTKRMLKRRDSYSPVISDSDGGVRCATTVQRTGSTGSLTDRRFRKDRGRRGSGDVGRASVETARRRSTDMGIERPSAPTPRAAAGAMGTGTGRKRGIWDRKGQEASGEDSSGDYAADDDSGGCNFSSVKPIHTSLQSNNSPTTARVKPKKHQKISTSIFRDSSSSSEEEDGHKRRNSDSDLLGRNTHKPPLSSGRISRFSSGDYYADSVGSLAHSELGSIAEDSLVNGGRIRKVPTKILEEDSEDCSWGDDTFDFRRGGRGIGRTGCSTTSPSHLLPPGTDVMPTTPHKYSPPPRSVSPAKSALKPSPRKPYDATSTRKTRVSFSDEDSFTHLPVLPRTMVHAVLAPSPPPSDSSQESIVGLESALRYPRGHPPLGAAVAVKRLLGVGGDGGGRSRKGPLTPPEVPELKLTPPMPGENGEGGLEGLPGGFSAGTRVGAGIQNTGQEGGAKDEDSDGSGNSIYCDAYEDLTALPEVAPITATPHTPPPPPQPAPPPTFLIPKTKRRQYTLQRQYPSPSSASTASSPSTSSSIISASSFRQRPRAKRAGMMTSMRAPPPPPTRSPGEKSKSRFSVDSERVVRRGVGGSDKVVGGAGAGERGFWGVFMGRGKGKMFTRGEQGKGKSKALALPADTKKSPTKRLVKPQPPRNSASATSVKEDLGKEVGLEGEAEGKQVIGYLKKRKRFWRVRRLLGLEE